MFNFQLVSIIYVISAIYIIQTLLFISSIYIFNKTAIHTNKMHLTSKRSYFFLFSVVVSYAGLPPLFMFFFKIVVFLKFSTSITLLISYIIVNSSIVFFYINFLIKLKIKGDLKLNTREYTTQKTLVGFQAHLIFINITLFLFLSYFQLLTFNV